MQDAGGFRVAVVPGAGEGVFTPKAWQGAPGGEGSQRAIDPTNPNLVYSHGLRQLRAQT
ncbi:MAG: hypothetical protein IPL75_23910 [Acidobacteria bacterium]|nr:hypothetical protein [Acidobacteriota bacterium]